MRILAASMDAASLAVLRGARARPTGDHDFVKTARRSDTPATVVLSTVVRADRGTLTVVAGPNAGSTIALEAEETILGRDPSANVVVDDPSVSRHHARITRGEKSRHFIEDLGSTNGTFVSGRRVRRGALHTGDRLQLGRDTVYRFAVLDREEEEFQRRLYDASMRDMLTQLPNRRTVLERLAGEIAHAERTAGELGVLMIDIDHFKSINDNFGHLAGDEVLKGVAVAGAHAIRAGDVFGRYGGEEFVVLARGAKMDEATALADRLRSSIADVRVELGVAAVGVTVSVGVATLSECRRRDDGTELLARADQRLYRAKTAGRNRTASSD